MNVIVVVGASSEVKLYPEGYEDTRACRDRSRPGMAAQPAWCLVAETSLQGGLRVVGEGNNMACEECGGEDKAEGPSGSP